MVVNGAWKQGEKSCLKQVIKTVKRDMHVWGPRKDPSGKSHYTHHEVAEPGQQETKDLYRRFC